MKQVEKPTQMTTEVAKGKDLTRGKEQKFEMFKKEVERWSINDKFLEEDRYRRITRRI